MERPPPLSKTTHVVDYGPRPSSRFLLADGSRWKASAGAGKIGPPQPANRYNLLLYLKGISEDQDVGPLVRNAFTSRQNLGKDYVVSNAGISETRLQGNDNAAALIAEWDAVIELARVVWDNPNNLEDWITHMFYEHFRGRILRDDETKAHTLARVLGWADRWAEVRYRYLNHYLRDDPDHWMRADQRAFREAGDHANEIVHTSSLQDDCLLAESKWFIPVHRALFFDVYRLGVREGRRLVYLANWTNLPGAIREVFRWSIDFINRYIHWREALMRAGTRDHLNEMRRSTQLSIQARQNQRVQFANSMKSNLRGPDEAYHRFLGVLRVLMMEGREQMKFQQSSWREFLTLIDMVTQQLRTCRLNRPNNNRHWDLRQNWPKHSSQDTFLLKPRAPHNRFLF
ncbi:hypothetical protein F4813DRAFT_350858 [Daldinia decipiens]|uniref:uncharacterized protein n=1 Tax=Daldinia decipiens TaxID=326647 RepID=UPI0020C588E2|nr:uncharacterized protein F4813DRAFT_350858 [Daldinia decipiens]KAI1660067.1 hypothetical protein F4813DRAFT_350858 [Daldinia decipiens]